jgi:Ca-activated chloride channel family protein
VRRIASVLITMAALSAATIIAQERIRTVTRTVVVYATVTDRAGQMLHDLPRDAFEVYDNGRRQPITIFENGVQPITLVMLLDRSASMATNYTLVEDAAVAFVERMLPQDRARIGSFAARIQIDPPAFTSDRTELLRIVREELQSAGPTPLWSAVDSGITALLGEEGRRVILVFTDGSDRPDGREPVKRDDVRRRAQQEDVMVYAIGLSSRFPAGTPDERLARKGSAGGLRELAQETGGGYFDLTSTADLAATFARVADELHRQYLIGFAPPSLDGRTHRLEVKVTRRDTTVRARSSYVAARE